MSTGTAEANSCRHKVQSILDEQSRKKQDQEAAARRALEDKKEAADNEARRKYGDEQQRTQAARDTAARKQAEVDAASRKRHDELIERQKQQRDKAAADARQEQQARDRRLGLDGQHSAWKGREDQRKAQIEQLENEAANIEDEQQRHAALESAVKKIQQIKAQRKQDPEPK